MPASSEGRFTLRPFGEDLEGDAHLLHVLSNYQVPQDPEGNREWQRNRLGYDETRGVRRHYIAHETATREPVAYASIDQQGANPTCFRLYLVFDPHRWSFSDLGEFLYQRLLEDAREIGATSLAFVEYATDVAFLDFLSTHDFREVGRDLYNEFEIVRMEKTLKL